MKKPRFLSRVEINKKALEHNIGVFKSLIDRVNKNGRSGKCVTLCLCVKANAYGNGIIECAKIISAHKNGGKNIWFGINSAAEAEILRGAGIKNPIYILGYVPLDQLEAVARLGCRLVVYNNETIEKLSKIASRLHKRIPVHIKIETGTNRQGLMPEEAIKMAKYIISAKALVLEGAAMHFANIEDTTDHSYAFFQFENFMSACKKIEDVIGAEIPIKHCANSAATILFPKMYLDMVRVGISLYGLWPSKETYISAQREVRQGGGRQSGANSPIFDLRPILSWKTHVVQIKEIPEDSYIGYGCSCKTTSHTKLALLPVGYYEGYDRKLSNTAYVLIKGKRAQIRGRICMNIMMADITDIPGVKLEDEVVLIGRQGNENISIEQVADWCGTINYEIPTRINERVPRVVV